MRARASVGYRGEAVSSFSVRFVDHEDVGYLHEACLIGLNRISPTGVYDNDCRVSRSCDINFHLANANRFDQDPWPTQRRELEPGECSLGRLDDPWPWIEYRCPHQ